MPESGTNAAHHPGDFTGRLGPAALQALIAAGRRRRFQRDQGILGQEDETSDACVLLEGRARVVFHATNGRSVNFRIIEAGSLFGEWSALDHAPRTADVVADSVCQVLFVPSQALHALIARESEIAHALVMYLVWQLRSLSKRAAEFRSMSANTRIDAELLRLAGPGGGHVTLPKVTHAEIARRAETTREAVTRRLTEQAAVGIISKRGRTLILLDRSALARLIEHPHG